MSQPLYIRIPDELGEHVKDDKGRTDCYAATDLAQHLSQLAAWAQPEQPGELVDAEIVVAEAHAIYAKAERQWMILASIDRELAYQMETARRHNFHGLVNTLQDLRNKLADAMSA